MSAGILKLLVDYFNGYIAHSKSNNNFKFHNRLKIHTKVKLGYGKGADFAQGNGSAILSRVPHLWTREKHVPSHLKILEATFGWLGQSPSQPNTNWLAGPEVQPANYIF